MSSAPSTARSLLTMVATFCSGAAGRSSGQRISTIRSIVTRPGRSTASSLSSVRDFRLPISPSVSWAPSRTTLNVPARRSSTAAAPLTDPAGPDLPTCTSYRWSARRASGAGAAARAAVAARAIARLSGLSPDGQALTAAPDEPAQDRRRPDDIAADRLRLDLVGLIGVEVAGVLVALAPGAQPGHVELRVELGRVDVAADPERLHRAASRTGQQNGPAGLAACGGGPGQAVDRLLVAGEGLEGRRQLAEQRILSPRRGQRDLDGADRLGVAPVDRRALVAAECPDAVTGPEEREVRAHHLVEQAGQVCLDPPLHRRLELLRVGVVEWPAAEQDPRPVTQVDLAERALLQPDAAQLTFGEPGQGQERVVLVVGRRVLGPDGQQQEWLHLSTLVTWRTCRIQPAETATRRRIHRD